MDQTFYIPDAAIDWLNIKAPANEETLLRKHCCFPKCFPVCADRKHLLRKHFLLLRNKNVSDFFQKHFGFSTNVSPFARRGNNVSATVFPQQCFLVCGGPLHLYVPVTVLVTLNLTVATTRRVKSAALHCTHQSGRTAQKKTTA